jgi:hypothetical protein
VALFWHEIRIEKVIQVTQCRQRRPSLESNLPKLGERGCVKKLREEDLPVALMHLIDFRPFLFLGRRSFGYDRITDVLAGDEALLRPAINSLAFPMSGAPTVTSLSQCLPRDPKALSTKKPPFCTLEMHQRKQHLSL